MQKTTTKDTISTRQYLVIAAIIIAAFNLRPAITSVGPLLGDIRDDIGLSNGVAGLITTLPLLAFAVMSPIASKLGNRLGNALALFFGLAILLAGLIIRSLPMVPLLFVGTTLIGFGIAISNVLLPAIIKDKFPNKVGNMTSVYTTSMTLMASTASGISVPLAAGLGMGWQLALLCWALLTVIGLLIWLVVIKQNRGARSESKLGQTSGEKLFRSPLAWQVTLFMGLQSFIFYVVVSWLPEMLHDFGFTVSTAGWLLFYAQIMGLPATFLTPRLAGRFSNQQGIVLVIAALVFIGFGGLLLGGPLPLIVVWVSFIGIALGGAISLSLALLGIRARHARQAAELSGMAQSLGYILAAVGPLLIGFLYDVTHTWTTPLITILIVILLMACAGVGAGRDKYVDEKQTVDHTP